MDAQRAEPGTDLVVPGMGHVAVRQARAWLERAEDLGDVLEFRDRAEAIRHYMAVSGFTKDALNEAAEMKLRSERRLGELLAEMPKNPGGRSTAPTLGAVGLNANQSQRWQRAASLPEPEFEAYVAETKAAERDLTSASVLKLAKRHEAADKPDVPPLRTEDAPAVFSTIVIDPPWRYDNRGTRGAAEDHYPTMSIPELEALELPAADDCHLYLWVTNPFLREGFVLLDAWGFTYKSCLTWVKPQMGMGNYFRSMTEHVLFGIKGKGPTLQNNVGTWFKADRTQHSAKPESFYDIVEKSSPGPWLEMFARRRRFGWHVWGNEA